MNIPQAWLDLRDAAKRVCDERAIIHRTITAVSDSKEWFASVFNETNHTPDCPGCALRAALEGVGVDTKRGVS